MTKQPGFVLVELVIGAVVLLIVASGIFVWQQNQNAKNHLSDQANPDLTLVSTTPTEPETIEEVSASPTPVLSETPTDSPPTGQPTPTVKQFTAKVNPGVATSTPTPQPTSVPPTEAPPTETPKPTVTPSPTPNLDQQPILKNLPVRFSPHDANTNQAGAFHFSYLSSNTLPLIPFGYTENGSPPRGEWDLITAKGEPVYAVADGIVAEVFLNPNVADYEILTTTVTGGSWQVWYDHLLNVQVQVGDTVTAGQQIGVVGLKDTFLGRTELTLRHSQGSSAYVVCPFQLFSAGLANTYKNQVSQLMQDWEDYTNNSSAYQQESHVAPGCLASQLDG